MEVVIWLVRVLARRNGYLANTITTPLISKKIESDEDMNPEYDEDENSDKYKISKYKLSEKMIER